MPLFAAAGVLRGLAIATCCHHRCTWQHYVNQPLFERLGFSPEEFELISWMTGECLHAAHCGPHDSAGRRVSRMLVANPLQHHQLISCTGWALCGHEAPPGTATQPQDTNSPCNSAADGEDTDTMPIHALFLRNLYTDSLYCALSTLGM